MNTASTNNRGGDDGGSLSADEEQGEPAKTRRQPDWRFVKGALSATAYDACEKVATRVSGLSGILCAGP